MSPTGKRAKRPKPEEWSFEITIRFVQVPDEKREAYHATLHWMAMRILEEMQNEQGLTVPQAEGTVNG